MHYYQFNIGDYKSHTEHLSELEDLAYRRLLDWYYLHEKPIPLDLNESARQIRMRSHTDCITLVLQEFFKQTDDGWIHHRANAEILKAGDKSQKASESAKARWNKTKDANALQPQSEGNATQDTEHITQNTKPKEKKPLASDGRFEDFWKAYPKKIGKDAARRAFDKRKITADMMPSVLQSVRKQCQSDAWKKDDGQFIPHPATWLNQGRWQDEIDTATAAPAEQSLMTRGGVEELALKLGEPRWSQMVPFESYRRKILTLAQERGFV